MSGLNGGVVRDELFVKSDDFGGNVECLGGGFGDLQRLLRAGEGGEEEERRKEEEKAASGWHGGMIGEVGGGGKCCLMKGLCGGLRFPIFSQGINQKWAPSFATEP